MIRNDKEDNIMDKQLLIHQNHNVKTNTTHASIWKQIDTCRKKDNNYGLV